MTDDVFEDGDDGLSIDMDAVETQSFELIPEGTYAGMIESCEFKHSKKGAPMWALILIITDGEFTGRKLFNYIVFSEKALPMAKSTLSKIAPALLSSTFDPVKLANEGALIGTNVRIQTKIEKYEGAEKTSVKNLLAPQESDDSFLNG